MAEAVTRLAARLAWGSPAIRAMPRVPATAGEPMRLLLAPILVIGLAACNQMATAPVTAPAALPEPAPGPAGPGCTAQIARFKEILAYDLSVGRVARSVYEKASGPIAQGESACAAGRSGEAMGILARTKRASGYG